MMTPSAQKALDRALERNAAQVARETKRAAELDAKAAERLKRRQATLRAQDAKRMRAARLAKWEGRYVEWVATMRVKYGASWTPPTCADTWRKWRNRRREKGRRTVKAIG